MQIKKITIEDSAKDVFKYETLEKLNDGDYSTYDAIWMDTTDGLIVMNSDKYNAIFWNLGTYNTVTADMYISYWDGKEWVDAIFTTGDDGTRVGGKTFATGGIMKIQMSRDWKQVTIDGKTGYA